MLIIYELIHYSSPIFCYVLYSLGRVEAGHLTLKYEIPIQSARLQFGSASATSLGSVVWPPGGVAGCWGAKFA